LLRIAGAKLVAGVRRIKAFKLLLIAHIGKLCPTAPRGGKPDRGKGKILADGKLPFSKNTLSAYRKVSVHKGGRPTKNQLHDETGLSDLGISRIQSHRWQSDRYSTSKAAATTGSTWIMGAVQCCSSTRGRARRSAIIVRRLRSSRRFHPLRIFSHPACISAGVGRYLGWSMPQSYRKASGGPRRKPE